MVCNISIGHPGYLSGCAPSQLLHTCSLAEYEKLEKSPSFHSNSWKYQCGQHFSHTKSKTQELLRGKSIPAKTRTYITWWHEQMEMHAVNFLHEVLTRLLPKRLAKGIALKPKVLASSWWEEIHTSAFVYSVSAPVKTPLWDIYMIPFSKDPAWQQRDGAVCFWGRSRVYFSNVQLFSPPLRQHHCHPNRCCHLHLWCVTLQEGTEGSAQAKTGHCLWLFDMWELHLFTCFIPFVLPWPPLLLD